MWRTSHVGDTINEWPDAEAGSMVKSTAAPNPVPRAVRFAHRTMKFNAHRKGAREWMGDMTRSEVKPYGYRPTGAGVCGI